VAQQVTSTGVKRFPRAELDTVYQRLNPLQLRRELEVALKHLWPRAARDPHRAEGMST
jgi:hypothetical protein